jgi:nucleoside-diphosphate-sugar epimerase
MVLTSRSTVTRSSGIACLPDGPIIVPEEGRSPIQWVHVGDVARAAVLAASDGRAIGRAYNVAGPPVTQIEYLKLLADIAGRRADLVFIPREEIHRQGGQLFAPPFYFGVYLDIPSSTVRIERARAEVGLDRTPLDEGYVKRIAGIYSRNGPGRISPGRIVSSRRAESVTFEERRLLATRTSSCWQRSSFLR